MMAVASTWYLVCKLRTQAWSRKGESVSDSRGCETKRET